MQHTTKAQRIAAARILAAANRPTYVDDRLVTLGVVKGEFGLTQYGVMVLIDSMIADGRLIVSYDPCFFRKVVDARR